MPADPLVVATLVLVAFAAGFVDAIAGGGGLIQLPPMLAFLGPGVALGTNKVSSAAGTATALLRYTANGTVRWSRVAIVGPIAFAASLLGAFGYLELLERHASAVEPAFAIVFLLLAANQVRRTFHPDTGTTSPAPRVAIGLVFCGAIALYDGAIGPGTGMFLFWAFTTWFALSPLEATSTTKAINLLTNLGALVAFVARDAVLWPIGLAMAGANVAGGFLGAHTAIRRGVPLIRLLTAVACAGASVYLFWRWSSR